MAKKLTRIVVGLAVAALTLAVIAFNVANLSEAFGNGPPYYARTTNMDKWTDPLPALAAVDIVTALVVGTFFYLCKRRGGIKPRA